jgi:diketogulonate reductase-like aldo/keto reductase
MDYLVGTYRMNDDKCSATIQHAIQVGYRLIDTASVYRNEEYIGHALQQVYKEDLTLKRGSFWITTKICTLYCDCVVYSYFGWISEMPLFVRVNASIQLN